MTNETEFYTTPKDYPVVTLECAAAFSKLTDREKQYAHWMNKAAWLGAPIVLEQVSPESPAIFTLLQGLFSDGVESLRSKCQESNVAEQEFAYFLQYAGYFYGNMGNYLSFGDSKFIPRCSQESFGAIVQASGNADLQSLYESQCRTPMYSLEAHEKSLGFPGSGISTYYGPNMSKQDIELVSEYLGVSPYNTRVFKCTDEGGKEYYEIRLASAETSNDSDRLGSIFEFPVSTGKSISIMLTRGDYAVHMQNVVTCLAKAREYSANETQAAMLDAYIKSFAGGSIDDHKAAQVHWVKDIGPVVETNIGFIESYRDPQGVRGEWEGFVAVVNKERSATFAKLVDAASSLLPRLPWPRKYEKDQFTKPDFTSLEVIGFAGSGIPAGINIPNYDDIRQDVGFKNVSLQNVLAAAYGGDDKFTFLCDDDQLLYKETLLHSFEVQVGCHELLGHGSGKCFFEESKNFDRDAEPLFYKVGQTYDSVFGPMASSYEECRAECVGLVLSADADVLRIFGFDDNQDITYINWLDMARKGLMALEFYSPETKKWRQAHSCARFCILQVMLRDAPQGFVQIADDDSKAIRLQKDMIQSHGVPAVSAFLQKLQIYKSTANIAAARELFESYTSVDETFLNYRDIVLARKKPRKTFVQHRTVLQEDGQVKLVEFPATYEGMVESMSHARFTL